MTLPESIPFGVRRFTFRIRWVPRDAWVGAFWRRRKYPSGARETHLWVCVLPMVPLHFHWWSRQAENERLREERDDAVTQYGYANDHAEREVTRMRQQLHHAKEDGRYEYEARQSQLAGFREMQERVAELTEALRAIASETISDGDFVSAEEVLDGCQSIARAAVEEG